MMQFARPALVGAVVTGGAVAGPVEPFNYLELDDSPWLDQPGFMVETLEDFSFDLPGVTPSTGAPTGPGGNTDSVDGDDGNVDGSGTDGRSFFSISGNVGITFTLDPNEIGFTPTRAGLVWTDGEGGLVTFKAYDLDGNLLHETTVDIADDVTNGTTAEDHFFGYEHPDGVGSLFISNLAGGIEVDHIQYAGGTVDDACPADCDGNGVLNILDFVCFQTEWQNQTELGDCDDNAQFNILDFVCYQGLFQQGCP